MRVSSILHVVRREEMGGRGEEGLERRKRANGPTPKVVRKRVETIPDQGPGSLMLRPAAGTGTEETDEKKEDWSRSAGLFSSSSLSSPSGLPSPFPSLLLQ